MSDLTILHRPCPFCTNKRLSVHKTQRGPGYDNDLDDPDAYAYFVFCNACAAQGPWVKSNAQGAWEKWDGRFLYFATREVTEVVSAVEELQLVMDFVEAQDERTGNPDVGTYVQFFEYNRDRWSGLLDSVKLTEAPRAH